MPSEANELIKSDNPEMTDDKIDYAIAEDDRKRDRAVSGDAELSLGIGVITDAKVEDFYNKMVASGVSSKPGMDYKSAYTTEFVGKGLGMDLVK